MGGIGNTESHSPTPLDQINVCKWHNTNYSTLLKWRPWSYMIRCCLTIHSIQKLLETNVYAIAPSVTIAIISRQQLGLLFTYKYVIFVRYDSFKIKFMKFQHKLIITTKVISRWLMQVNMNKVVIKILRGSVVTRTVLGGLTIYSLSLQISYKPSVCVPKIM